MVERRLDDTETVGAFHYSTTLKAICHVIDFQFCLCSKPSGVYNKMSVNSIAPFSYSNGEM